MYSEPRSQPARLVRPASHLIGAGVATIVAAVVVLLSTQRVSFQGAVDDFHYFDIRSYLAIANAAPGFPDERIGSAFTYRWPIHWAIGALAEYSGSPLWLVYYVIVAAVLSALLWALWASVAERAGLLPAAVATAIVVVIPYNMKLYAVAAPMLADAVCALGGVLTVRYLLRGSSRGVIVGCLVMTISRQTGLALLPLVAAWCMWGPGWSSLGQWRRISTAVLSIGLPIAVSVIVVMIAAPFTYNYSPDPIKENVLVDLTLLPGSAVPLVQHVVLSLLPIWFSVAGVLVLRLIRPRNSDPTNWWIFASGLLVGLQALPVSPRFAGWPNNEPRVAAIGLPILVMALVSAWRPISTSIGNALIGLAGLALVSVSHGIGLPVVSTPILVMSNLVGGILILLFLVGSRTSGKRWAVASAVSNGPGASCAPRSLPG